MSPDLHVFRMDQARLIVLEGESFSDLHGRRKQLIYAPSGLVGFLVWPEAVHRLEEPVWISNPSIPRIGSSSFSGLPL